MNWRDRTKLRGLLLGRRIAQETAAANLRAGQVLQEVGLAERRVKLDVKITNHGQRPWYEEGPPRGPFA